MRPIIAMIVSTLLTVLLVLVALSFRDPLPPLVIAVLLWPLEFGTLIFISMDNKSDVDLIALRNNANINQIRVNTDRMK